MQTRNGSYRNPGASDDLGKCFDFHIKKNLWEKWLFPLMDKLVIFARRAL